MIRKGDGVIVLRALRLKEGRRGKNRDLINRVMGDGDLAAIVSAGLERKWPSTEIDPEDVLFAGDVYGGKWQDFLQWILDNQDQIIAFIQAIIAMFMSADEEEVA